MAMLLSPPTKPITLPRQSGLAAEDKKKEYARPNTKGRGVSYGTYDYGGKSGYPLGDEIGSSKK